MPLVAAAAVIAFHADNAVVCGRCARLTRPGLPENYRA